MPLPLTNPTILTFNNYPAAWQAHYQAKNYVAVDPTVHHAMHSLQPIVWSDDLFSSAHDLWEEANSFGLRYGWAQSIRDFNGVVGMLTLARSNDPITEIELEAKHKRQQKTGSGLALCISLKQFDCAKFKTLSSTRPGG